MRLIDADELLSVLNSTVEAVKKTADTEENRLLVYTSRVFRMMISDSPTLEVEPVVHCKDCKYYNRALRLCNKGLGSREFDFYCAHGEGRRVDNEQN